MLIDRNSEVPISQQIAAQIRERILSGDLPAGRPVPSKRAGQLPICRLRLAAVSGDGDLSVIYGYTINGLVWA